MRKLLASSLALLLATTLAAEAATSDPMQVGAPTTAVSGDLSMQFVQFHGGHHGGAIFRHGGHGFGHHGFGGHGYGGRGFHRGGYGRHGFYGRGYGYRDDGYGYHHHHGYGGAVAAGIAGLAAGAIIGGAISHSHRHTSYYCRHHYCR